MRIRYLFIFIFTAAITVLGIRGGLSERPIVLIDAAMYASPKFIPIVINTPFSILKSADLTELKPITLFTEEELKKRYTPIHTADTGSFKNYNLKKYRK